MTLSTGTRRYSVEASTSTSAWVCILEETRDARGVRDYAEKLCILTNVQSAILGIQLDAEEIDAAGKTISVLRLRAAG